jgi:membrane fusion protein, multidrug efflux system
MSVKKKIPGKLAQMLGSKHMRRTLLMGVPVLVLAFVGLWVYATGGRWMQTENAYIKANKAQISAEISGTITRMNVRDNQRVKVGEVLFSLDTQRYISALDAARAAYDETLGQMKSAKANYRQKLSERATATENLNFAKRELKRRKALAKRKIVAEATLDEYLHDRDVAALKLKTKTQELLVLRALLGDPAADVRHHPRVRGTQAKMELAEKDLNNAIVRAPISGIIGAAPVVGDYVRAGAPVMVIVADKALWIEANFKETALTYMQTGQKVNLRIDAYPDVPFHGYVSSIDPATGAEFSLLPAQNASGNWVKVVQRVPVRITINPAKNMPVLRAGMSVRVRIDTGHYRALPAVLKAPLRWMGADVG